MTQGRQRVARANRNLALKGRSWVYFAQAGEGGPVKIGQTRQLERRIHALGTASAEPIKLLGKVPETWLSEQRLHNLFAPVRVRGEWFEPHPRLLELAEAGGVIFARGYTDTWDGDEIDIILAAKLARSSMWFLGTAQVAEITRLARSAQ